MVLARFDHWCCSTSCTKDKTKTLRKQLQLSKSRFVSQLAAAVKEVTEAFFVSLYMKADKLLFLSKETAEKHIQQGSLFSFFSWSGDRWQQRGWLAFSASSANLCSPSKVIWMEKRRNLKRHFNACSITSTPVRDEQRGKKRGSCAAARRARMEGFNRCLCRCTLRPLVPPFQTGPWKGSLISRRRNVVEDDVRVADWHIFEIQSSTFICTAAQFNISTAC